MTPTPAYQTLLTLMRDRRSIRRFKAASLPEGTLELLLEAARWAPSANNRQAFRFLAVEDPPALARMAELVRAASRDIAGRLTDDERPRVAAYAEAFVHFESAPAVLVAYHRAHNPLAERLGFSGNRDVGAISSVSAAIMNLLLAAHALGLGACWMTGPLVAAPALEQFLAIPQGWQLSALLPVGVPDELPPAPARRGIAQMLSRFGGSP
ncbi:MAG TPA: nitroreductase family protein [Polyangia bacterium]